MSQELAPKPPRRGLRRAIYCTVRNCDGPVSAENIMSRLDRKELKGVERQAEFTLEQTRQAFHGMLKEGYLLREKDGNYRIASRGHFNSKLGYRLQRAERAKLYFRRKRQEQLAEEANGEPGAAFVAPVFPDGSLGRIRPQSLHAIAPRPRKGYAFKAVYDILLQHGAMTPDQVVEHITPDMLSSKMRDKVSPYWANTIIGAMCNWGYTVRIPNPTYGYAQYRIASLSEWRAAAAYREGKLRRQREAKQPTQQYRVSWLQRVLNRIGW